MEATGEIGDTGGGTALPPRVGERLRAAREAAGFDLGDIAARTRIPVRHLEAIERAVYTDLPAPTYAIGFARAYARAIGVDEVDVARDVRAELGREPVRRPDAPSYQPVDPARVPSRLLAWTTLAIAAAFLIGFLTWRSLWFADTPTGTSGAPPGALAGAPGGALAGGVASIGGPSAVPGAPAVAGAVASGGQVVLTATSPVWIEITDATGEKFALRELKAGERFEVPKTADRPVLTTGRPNALRITVDGREIATLGPAERRIKDVAISATALAARAQVGQPPSAGGQGGR